MAPQGILLVHGKAEASFAHSKRFAQYDIAVHVGASRCEGATEPRGSVWSARSLLPLWLVPGRHALWNRRTGKLESCFVSGSMPMGRAEAPFRPAQILRRSPGHNSRANDEIRNEFLSKKESPSRWVSEVCVREKGQNSEPKKCHSALIRVKPKLFT